MSRKNIFLGLLFFLTNCFLLVNTCFSQVKEEYEERPVAIQRLLKKKPYSYKLTYQAVIFSGVDTNVKLSPQAKADVFEEALFSLNFSKPWKYGLNFTFDYDIDFLNYSAITDATNLLNSLKFAANRKIAFLNIGTGYTFNSFHYPHNQDGDFLAHKPFLYARSRLMKKSYHQLFYEYRFKRHTDRNALDNNLGAYQDKLLEDTRHSIEYSIGSNDISQLFLKFGFKFYVNDSNAKYQDYYDYKAYEFSPSLNYKLNRDTEILASFTYTKRDYKSRQITLSTPIEEDDIYDATVGLRYKLAKENLLSLIYSYRENASNDDLQSYTENIISCGWQHNF